MVGSPIFHHKPLEPGYIDVCVVLVRRGLCGGIRARRRVAQACDVRCVPPGAPPNSHGDDHHVPPGTPSPRGFPHGDLASPMPTRLIEAPRGDLAGFVPVPTGEACQFPTGSTRGEGGPGGSGHSCPWGVPGVWTLSRGGFPGAGRPVRRH